MADLLSSFWSPVGKPNSILHYITLYNHHFWSVDVYGLFCGDFSKITISRYIISSGFHSSPPIDKVDKVRFPILVGGFKHFLFSIIYGIILPIDELIFFRGVGIPPTSIASVVCSTFLHRFFGFLPISSNMLIEHLPTINLRGDPGFARNRLWILGKFHSSN